MSTKLQLALVAVSFFFAVVLANPSPEEAKKGQQPSANYIRKFENSKIRIDPSKKEFSEKTVKAKLGEIKEKIDCLLKGSSDNIDPKAQRVTRSADPGYDRHHAAYKWPKNPRYVDRLIPNKPAKFLALED